MIGTWVRPNHLTTLRLLSGLAACACFAFGTRGGMVWGGGLWLVSAFLDRADGELARLGKLSSPGGHLYDYYTDNLVNALFFAAIGVGLRHGWLGHWSIPLGIVSGRSLHVGSSSPSCWSGAARRIRGPIPAAGASTRTTRCT